MLLYGQENIHCLKIGNCWLMMDRGLPDFPITILSPDFANIKIRKKGKSLPKFLPQMLHNPCAQLPIIGPIFIGARRTDDNIIPIFDQNFCRNRIKKVGLPHPSPTP